ncbi:amidase [Rugamonas sp. CCM 8940]|uniref:amidase n=1 Tax=Rugamonas sp. CCM 8940 TaxID=2765359 RepID=UPI0018F55386|nr:amidase [Rugamonas sp. CCM 8940]MBJ7313227.1 amidase [Rugamonas sp. CCM 8940]
MTLTATPQRPAMPDAVALKQQLERGESSAAELLRQHLARLDATQGALNGATQVLRDEAAEAVRQARPGPLAGLPCTVKETFGIAGQSITAGSLRMTPQPQAADASVVAKLRAAGAIVIARSNVPEFAMTGESSNPRYGRTNNPLDPSRVAGGSTGGEGALVGSGASAFGLGSDILGSIRIPAAFCGLVGFKPASGAVDGTGTWPQIDGHTASWLGIGPITRSVRDARMVYQVIAERAPAPPAPLAGLRLIGPAGFPYSVESPCIGAALASAQTALGQEGMRPETAAFGDVGQLFFRMPSMILHDAAPSWQRLLSTPEAGRFNVWGEALRQLTGRATIDPGLFMWMLQGATLGQFIKPRGAAQLARLIATFEAARAHYRGLLGADGILLLPTLGMLAPKHGGMNRKTLRPGPNGLMTPITFCNYCDLPTIAVPAWRHADPASGLAPSVMLACAPGAEGHLFDAAAAVEAALN